MLTPEQQVEALKGELGESQFNLEQATTEADRMLAAADTAIAERDTLRQQNQCLLGQLSTVRDGSNAHAANLTRMARENVELHTTLARYKAALEIYADDGNWTYNTANDDCIWARDEHGATTAARALHEEGATS